MVTPSAAIRGGGLQKLSAALGKPGVKAKAAQLIGDSANSGTALIGGPGMNPGDASPLTAGTGFPIMKTAYLYLPYLSIFTDVYDFDNIWVYVAQGDILYILYEQG